VGFEPESARSVGGPDEASPRAALRSCHTRRPVDETHSALVRRATVLLVGERTDERGVDVDRDVALRRCGPDDLRVFATAFLIPRGSSDVVALTALQAVEIDPTFPNSSDWHRSASKSLSSRPRL
jgi:hypothetical protein